MDNINKTQEMILTFRDVEWSPALQMHMAGYSHCAGDYRIERAPGPLFVFEYVESGSGTLKINDEVWNPADGDVYIIPGWKSHLYYSSERAPWRKYWLNLTGPLPEMLLKCYGLEGHILFQDRRETGLLIKKTVLELKEMPREKIPFFTEETILHVIQKLAEKNRHPLHQGNTLAIQLRNWLKTRITEEVPSIELMAKRIGYSPIHTIRLFKQETGMTPVDFLLSEKMELAKELLQNTRKNVKEIAMAVGFRDEFYFSRIFTKRCGISPARYRKTVFFQ